MSMINPYYNPGQLNLVMNSFEEPLSYEYNTLCFWNLEDTNQVYTASDSGCSCPIPFEYYQGKIHKKF